MDEEDRKELIDETGEVWLQTIHDMSDMTKITIRDAYRMTKFLDDGRLQVTLRQFSVALHEHLNG